MSALVLKIIAYATMLIDHTAAVLGKNVVGIFKKGLGKVMPVTDHYLLYRSIGRVAFPIFAFQLVEGAKYTKSRWKYVLRIFLIALISEVPFDLALRNSFMDFGGQNVYFTLLLGLPVLFMIQETAKMAGWKKAIGAALTVGVGVASGILATIMKTDYSWHGIILIAMMGVLLLPEVDGVTAYPWRSLLRTAICGVAILILSILTGGVQYYALFALIPIFFYNGKKGYNKAGQIIFYAFYPVHLLVLGLIFVLPRLL